MNSPSFDDAATTYCFESETKAQWHATHFPEGKERIFSFEGLISVLSGPDPRTSADRKQEFLELCDNKANEIALIPERALVTIETLRSCLVFTHEDVDFCFSTLPITPKNIKLASVFHRYLDSPLAHDLATRAWQARERLSQGATATLAKTFFIRDVISSPLFAEVSKSFGATLVNSWEIAFNKNDPLAHPPYALRSAPDLLLERLAKRVERLLEAASSRHVVIAFEGSAAEKAFLKFQLACRRLIYEEEWLEPPPLLASTVPDRETQLARLKRCHSFALSDRLRWSAVIGETLPLVRSELSWKQLLERLVEKQRLSSEEAKQLEALPAQESLAAPAQQPRITITDFSLPVSCKNTAVLGFLSPSKPFQERYPLLLRPDERDLLYRAGFPIPTIASETRRRGELIEAFSLSARTVLFSTGSVPYKTFELKKAIPSGNTEPPSITVSLPTRSLSATQLEAYAECPTRYLLANRLRLKRGGIKESAFALLLGQATHLALENEFKRKPLSIQSESLRQAFDKALEQLAPQLESSHPVATILRSLFAQFADRVEPLEAQLRLLTGGSTPEGIELPFTLSVGEVSLTGKIDRIDKLASGDYLILDYKTGNVDFTPNHIIQGVHFQALLYLLAGDKTLSSPTAGMLFYDLKTGEVRRGILRSERFPPEAKKLVTRGHALSEEAYAELKASGLSALDAIARKIQAGDFSPTPSASVCEYCEFPAFCRKGYGYA